MADDQTKRGELKRLYSQADAASARLQAKGQEAIQYAQSARDAVIPAREMLDALPSGVDLGGEHIDRNIGALQSYLDSAQTLEQAFTDVSTFGVHASGVTNTVVSMFVAVPVYDSHNFDAFNEPKSHLMRNLDRSPKVAEVREAMKRLGLDKRAESYRSALGHLDDAVGAFEHPSSLLSGPAGVLIPLRESIDASISELIRRRPNQERVKGWAGKVISLGEQCGRPGLEADHFRRLADEAELVMDRLSQAKQSELARKSVADKFHNAVVFLHALLTSIEETRLRA